MTLGSGWPYLLKKQSPEAHRCSPPTPSVVVAQPAKRSFWYRMKKKVKAYWSRVTSWI